MHSRVNVACAFSGRGNLLDQEVAPLGLARRAHDLACLARSIAADSREIVLLKTSSSIDPEAAEKVALAAESSAALLDALVAQESAAVRIVVALERELAAASTLILQPGNGRAAAPRHD